MKLSACMPTRGRGGQVVRCVQNFYETTAGHDVEMVVVSHPDDAVEKLRALSFPKLQVHVADCSAIEGWNIAASFATGDFLKVYDDDLWSTPSWLDNAEMMHRDLGSPDLLYMGLWDEHRHVPDSLFTRAIGTRKFFKEVCGGVLTIPAYKSWYDDNEKFDLAKLNHCAAYCPQSVIEHHHPCNGYGWDSTYQIGASRQHNDEQVYYRRKSAGFPKDYTPVF